MRRDLLKFVAAAALPAFAPALRAASPSAPAAPALDVLQRPSARSHKAAGAVMLAVARAGRRLVAAGERGFVLLSDDDGATWRQAGRVPVSVTLTAVHFADAQRGCVVGHLGVILHTEDGGETWTLALDGLKAAALSVEAAQASGDAKAQAVARTFVDDGPDKPFLDVFFETPGVAFAVGAYGMAFRSDDGGRQWRCWMTQVDNPKGLHLHAIRASGKGLVVVGEQGLLLRAPDAAGRLVRGVSPYAGSFFGVVAGEGGHLLLLGLRGRAFRSSDDGRTWEDVEMPTRSSLTAGIRLANGATLATAQGGELLVSRGPGQPFSPSRQGAGVPVHAAVQSAAGPVVLATMRGMRAVPLDSLLS